MSHDLSHPAIAHRPAGADGSAGADASGVGGPHLYSRTLGESGPRVVFLHGVLGQGRNWTAVAKALVAEGHRATLLDLPNHGHSPWTQEFSYTSMTATVAAELERLVVVDIAPVSYGSVERGFTSIMTGMHRVDLAGVARRAEADVQLQPWIGDARVRAFVLQNLHRGADASGKGQGFHWQVNLELLRHHLKELGDWDVAGLEPYRGPVLWLVGADSEYVSDAVVPAMRALFPLAQKVSVRGAGHWVHSEQPEVTIEALRRFLDDA